MLMGAASERAGCIGGDDVAAVQPPWFPAAVGPDDHAAAHGEVVGQPRSERVYGDYLVFVQEARGADALRRGTLGVKVSELACIDVYHSQFCVRGDTRGIFPAVEYEPLSVGGEIQIIVEVLRHRIGGELAFHSFSVLRWRRGQ